MNQRVLAHLTAGALLIVSAVGCSSMKNGSLAEIRPVSQKQSIGNVYLIRGLIGLFSAGIDRLTVKINDAGIHAEVFQEAQDDAIARTIIEQYRDVPGREPIVLIGHSVGAEDVISVARKLGQAHIDVDLLVTLDATNPRTVPPNVKCCVNYYQSGPLDFLPVLRGVALKSEKGFAGELANLDVRRERRDLLEWDTNHVNIDKNSKIHADILRRVMQVCLPRDQVARKNADDVGHVVGVEGDGKRAHGRSSGTTMPFGAAAR